jgi:hypothetical protein
MFRSPIECHGICRSLSSVSNRQSIEVGDPRHRHVVERLDDPRVPGVIPFRRLACSSSYRLVSAPRGKSWFSLNC